MRQRPGLFLLPLLTLTVVAGAFMSPPGARAASGQVPKPAPGAFGALRGAPRSVTAGNVLYHSGPVMAGEMQVYVIFWEPGGAVVSAKFNMLVKRYFRDVGDSGLYANNAQYTDSGGQAPAGAELAGTFVDRSPYPAVPVLQDSDIRNEVTHAMSVEGWTPGISHLFFVYTALNESICSPFGCSPPSGGMAPIMGGEWHPAIVAWCRMFAPADITRTAIGPVSRRQTVLANPAPLDIDEPWGQPHEATDA